MADKAQPHIRLAEPRDVPALVEFNVAMAHETEGKSLGAETVGKGVHAVLADSGKGFYVVAEDAGQVVGSLLITFEWSDWRNGVFWWIQSVYVRPDQRRRGIFRSLGEFVDAEAKARPDVCGVRLYVHDDNEPAQAVYQKLGMSKTAYRLFDKELDRS